MVPPPPSTALASLQIAAVTDPKSRALLTKQPSREAVEPLSERCCPSSCPTVAPAEPFLGGLLHFLRGFIITCFSSCCEKRFILARYAPVTPPLPPCPAAAAAGHRYRGTPAPYVGLLQRLLRFDPSRRLTVDEARPALPTRCIIFHPFLLILAQVQVWGLDEPRRP